VDGVVIKTRAVAINPIDWLIQEKGDIMYGWLKYPMILGFDVAGEVVEVGKNVARFQAGDRVIGLTRGTDEKINNPAEGGFQEYTVLQPDLTAHIPSTMSFESAAVIPLGLATAAAGLFQKDQLGLQYPTANPKLAGKTLIVWGGSTSVGSNAIQLGVAAGYEVFTTASPSNFAYVKKLGARQVFDYKSPSVVADMVKAFKGKTAAGALAIGPGGAEACMAILDKVQGNKFVSLATYPLPRKEPENLVMLRTIYFFVSWIAAYKLKGHIKGIKSNFIVASSVAHNDVGKTIFVDFLPEALRAGSFIAAPESYVFGKGLENIQGAMEYQKKGMSAKKVVVSL
jgi:NADPH:quinone reductase-like Zn-dependent oxidoreductase